MFFSKDCIDVKAIVACIVILILVFYASFRMYFELECLFSSNCKKSTRKLSRKVSIKQTSCCCDPCSGLAFYCDVCESKK